MTYYLLSFDGKIETEGNFYLDEIEASDIRSAAHLIEEVARDRNVLLLKPAELEKLVSLLKDRTKDKK